MQDIGLLATACYPGKQQYNGLRGGGWVPTASGLAGPVQQQLSSVWGLEDFTVVWGEGHTDTIRDSVC